MIGISVAQRRIRRDAPRVGGRVNGQGQVEHRKISDGAGSLSPRLIRQRQTAALFLEEAAIREIRSDCRTESTLPWSRTAQFLGTLRSPSFSISLCLGSHSAQQHPDSYCGQHPPKHNVHKPCTGGTPKPPRKKIAGKCPNGESEKVIQREHCGNPEHQRRIIAPRGRQKLCEHQRDNQIRFWIKH